MKTPNTCPDIVKFVPSALIKEKRVLVKQLKEELRKQANLDKKLTRQVGRVVE